MTFQNKIEGIITLISPMHCATADSSIDSSSLNGTPTHKQKILTKKGTKQIPYFPGNSLRGRLRRKAAKIIMDHITATAKVKLDLYAGLMAGAISASPESDATVEEVLRSRDNVYMGLFGGGTRMLRSRYRACDLMPIIQDTIDTGIVPKNFAEEGTPQGRLAEGVVGPLTGYHLVNSRTSFRIDDVGRVMDPTGIEKYVEDSLTAVAEKQAAVLSGRAERKSDKLAAAAGEIKTSEVAGKKDLGNMFSVEAMISGTPLHCLIDLMNDVSDAHVGLLLLALQDVVREQAMGGLIRSGFGRFNANLTLTRNGQKYTVFAEGKTGADAMLSDEIQKAFCSKAREAIATLTAESMMEFFIPRVKEKEAKEPKAKKVKAAEVAA